jgi:hypothetical protein
MKGRIASVGLLQGLVDLARVLAYMAHETLDDFEIPNGLILTIFPESTFTFY